MNAASGSADRMGVERRREQIQTHHRSGAWFRQRPRSWLGTAAWAALVCAFILVLVLEGRSARQRTLEATAQMERLAVTLGRARTIAPATAREIAEVIRQPRYDCTQVSCDATLAARNRVARSKLQMLLGTFAAPGAPPAGPAGNEFAGRTEASGQAPEK
jgi:hypothetical protein